MKTKEKTLSVISKKLNGIPWAIFAGTAIEILTNGQRIGNDIDIIVPGKFLDEVAKRFNTKIEIRNVKKGEVELIDDYHVVVIIDGYPVEIVGKTGKMIINGREYFPSSIEAEKELFEKIEKMSYLGVEVFITPVEEIIAHKITFDRTGKRRDREDVQLLLKTQKINKDKLKLALRRWKIPEKDQNVVFNNLFSS